MKEEFSSKFVNTFDDLIEEIKNLFPETYTQLLDSEKILKLTCEGKTELLRKYYENTKKVGIELSEKNEIIFSKDVVILEGINFFEIWNTEISEESREIIWKFLHTMYLYADQAIQDTSLAEIMKLYKKASKKENLKVGRETKILFGILDNICGNKLGITSSNKEIEKRCQDEETKSTNNNSSLPMPSLPSLPFSTEGIFSGQIGQLATEIAGELDTSKLEQENPNEMIQNLLSGNLNEDSPVLKLVHQISDKIQTKLTSGEVNEKELFQEAQGAMKMMGGKNKQSPFNILNKMTENMGQNMDSDDNSNPDDIAKHMEEMLKNSGINTNAINNLAENLQNNLPDMSNMTKTTADPDNKEADKRRILKERLKQKKKLMETKKKLDKLRK